MLSGPSRSRLSMRQTRLRRSSRRGVLVRVAFRSLVDGCLAAPAARAGVSPNGQVGRVTVTPKGGTIDSYDMSVRDAFHNHVRHALERDGWTITHDPLRLSIRRRKLYVDLGAERLLAAEKGIRRIAVEIKTFAGPSEVRDLEDAVGQFVVYEHALQRADPGRALYLAVPDAAWQLVFADALGEILIDDQVLRVIVFDPNKEEVVRWIP